MLKFNLSMSTKCLGQQLQKRKVANRHFGLLVLYCFRIKLKSSLNKQVSMSTVESGDFRQSLTVALEQNFEHARHIELQRQQQLYIFIAIIVLF
jgi:hypothetical protein